MYLPAIFKSCDLQTVLTWRLRISYPENENMSHSTNGYQENDRFINDYPCIMHAFLAFHFHKLSVLTWMKHRLKFEILNLVLTKPLRLDNFLVMRTAYLVVVVVAEYMWQYVIFIFGLLISPIPPKRELFDVKCGRCDLRLIIWGWSQP